MVFTTGTFFFVFLPIVILAYNIAWFLEQHSRIFKKIRIKDVILAVLSIAFYAWACAENAIWLILYAAAVYLLGFLIGKTRDMRVNLFKPGTERGKFHFKGYFRIGTAILIFSSYIVLTILVRYKYADFINESFSAFNISVAKGRCIMAPLGISFIAFTSISYLADINRSYAEAGSLLDCILYITFFPKIVSGPIVLWRDFSAQLHGNSISLSKTFNGVNRICLGFAKKLLLADTFALTISQIDSSCNLGMDSATAWLSALLYMLEIYYDFSGYSDIAIGVSNILGYEFKENFNFPYRSLSITEFWKRWHISLGSWFREYVYIPLGGSRRGMWRTLLNLGIVFTLTGIWHGANSKYIIWGAINGFFVIVERVIRDKKFYKNIPSFIKWAFTMFIVLMFWELFRFPETEDVFKCFSTMFTGSTGHVYFSWRFFLDRKLIFLIITGAVGATLLGSEKLKSRWLKLSENKLIFGLQEAGLILLLVLSVISMLSSTFHPFIYFQY